MSNQSEPDEHEPNSFLGRMLPCISPMPPPNEKKGAQKEEARKGLLNMILQHRLKTHFSSTPIDNRSDVSDQSTLTQSERSYLSRLLQTGDFKSLNQARSRLQDTSIFPTKAENETKESESSRDRSGNPPPAPGLGNRRNSLIQQELYKLHQSSSKRPSQLLSRMSFASRNSFLANDRANSLLLGSPSLEDSLSVASPVASLTGDTPEERGINNSEWNPFENLSSWLDGSEGIEVSEEQGVVIEPPFSPSRESIDTSSHFKILGTSGDDNSCHPHVLSPPLMEALASFLPEHVADDNFWLKYSMVRDGANFWNLLRHVRASPQTILAVETTDGHVIGAFTSNSWRLAQGWYGSQTKDAFLFKMRHSRLETTKSIVQQACQESEIQVFPYREGHIAVQYCSASGGLCLGQAEMTNLPMVGDHYGCGLCIESNLRRGHTSNSETFGNPCLIDDKKRGARFEIANIEIWTLTSCATIEEAEQSELSALFLEGGRDEDMNVLGIMTGGAI